MRYAFLVVAAWLWAVSGAWAALPKVVGQDSIHVVGPNEKTEDIAHNYRLALEHLAFANGINIDQYVPEVDAGYPLFIPGRRILPLDPPRDGIVLNVPERGLYLFRHGQYQGFFPVAVGRPHFETPRGQFYIINKTVNPTWVPPSWAVVPKKIYYPGPDNPLGDRWIGLSAHGVGIHGTVSPDAIGMNISHGCIRMYPDLEHQLYSQVDVGMPVRIEYEPVKVGRDASGQVCIAVFPDVYGLVNLRERAMTLLRGMGVPQSRIDAFCTQSSGRVCEVDADPILVKADDLDVAAAPQPVRLNDVLWLPQSTVQGSGVGVAEAGDQLTMTWQTNTCTLPLADGAPASPDHAYRWRGTTWLPATQVLHALSIPYRWMANSSLLWIRPQEETAGTP